MFTIGIDLGGTNIVASVVNEKYEIISTDKTPTNSPRPADEVFDDIARVCFSAVEKAGLKMDDIASVGIFDGLKFKVTKGVSKLGKIGKLKNL